MKHLLSVSLLAIIPFLNLCSTEKKDPVPKTGLIIKTVDGFGKSVEATIVYESQDCEFDFNTPSRATSDKKGITRLNVPAGYVQFYAEGFLHESYKCIVYSGNSETITIIAAPIPTIIKTTPNAVINYFANTSGDCLFEPNTIGTTVQADKKGKAIIYLPLQETYKIQVNGEVQCFQPDQEVHTLQF